jgi:hypothetical protein
VLEHSGANPIFDVVAAAGFEHNRIDAVEAEQMREHEPGRSGADDADLCARLVILTASAGRGL